MSLQGGTFRCDRCGYGLTGDSIHAAAQVLDLDEHGDVLRLQLCRDHDDGSGKVVTGCVKKALTLNTASARQRRK